MPSNSARLSPLVARKFELFISKTDSSQAGRLADFMADVSDSSFEEKLRVLASLDVGTRLERVIDILGKQVQSIKSNVKVTNVSSTNVPPSSGFDISQIDPRERELLARRAMTGLTGLAPPGLPGMGGGRNNDSDDKEPNEVDELDRKSVV